MAMNMACVTAPDLYNNNIYIHARQTTWVLGLARAVASNHLFLVDISRLRADSEGWLPLVAPLHRRERYIYGE